MTRLRDLGLAIGSLPTGPRNAITDIDGVRVGHTTVIRGDGPLVVGVGPVRTGVTVVIPAETPTWSQPLFAGSHVLNGNGEVSGLAWLQESGTLTTPVGLTNTHSLGVVRDALVRIATESRDHAGFEFSLPVVGETFDGVLNDINGQHITLQHVREAYAAAVAQPSHAPVPEGSVGGGTGMICHGFKGGIGTSSRVIDVGGENRTVGVLVQANHGRRARFAVEGVRVGAEISLADYPVPVRPARVPEGMGSIIIVVATDAPLLPHQLNRLAARAFLGVGRVGGLGEHSSGDISVAFSTAAQGLPSSALGTEQPARTAVTFTNDGHLDVSYEAVVEATEEAIVNAITASETMTGRDGNTVHGLPAEVIADLVRRRL